MWRLPSGIKPSFAQVREWRHWNLLHWVFHISHIYHILFFFFNLALFCWMLLCKWNVTLLVLNARWPVRLWNCSIFIIMIGKTGEGNTFCFNMCWSGLFILNFDAMFPDLSDTNLCCFEIYSLFWNLSIVKNNVTYKMTLQHTIYRSEL